MLFRSVAVLLITHNMDRVIEVCDRAVILRQGRKVAELDVASVTKDDLVGYITGAKDSDGHNGPTGRSSGLAGGDES